MPLRVILVVGTLLLGGVTAVEVGWAQSDRANATGKPELMDGDHGARKQDETRRQGPPHEPAPFFAQPVVDVIAARPSERAITLTILHHQASQRMRLAVTDERGRTAVADRTLELVRGEPLFINLNGLQPDSGYRYTVTTLDAKGLSTEPLAEGHFHTQRRAGQGFTFTITADSHLDQNTDPAVYERTLKAIRGEDADFHVDLGDTFMVDKHANRDAAWQQYLQQRYYFGLLGTPLYLVLGNHDGEDRKLLRVGSDSLAAWANQTRKHFFANPEPNGFYSGNRVSDKFAGSLEDYYAWQWGDALFVVLNPYWHGPRGRSDDGWGLTLGDEQYQWLRQTLQASQARFKLVFVHQLVGGQGRQGRGGVEAASYGEWGGQNPDGSPGFAAHREGWPEPIHSLLIRTGVTAVFHGHDHLFAHQKLDGITYQEVPQPGHPGESSPTQAQEYGYRQGTILGSSGYMRLLVTSSRLKVDFVETSSGLGHVVHTYYLSGGSKP